MPIDLGLQGDADAVLMVQRSFVEKYGKEIGTFSGETGGVLFVRLTDGAGGETAFSASSVGCSAGGTTTSTPRR